MPYSLSKADVEILMSFIGELKRGRINTLGTGGQPRTWDAGDDQITVGDLIAIPLLNEGIPGLTIAGPVKPADVTQGALQIPGSGDVAGIGLCDVYRIQDSDETGYSELYLVDKRVQVYNLSQERLGRDWLSVTKTKQGIYLASPREVILEGILLTEMEEADGPLTGATAALISVIEYSQYNMTLQNDAGVKVNKSIEEVVPSTWKTANRILSVINRSVSTKGAPGTYGKFRKCGGELRPIDLDCAPSEEGVQIVIEYEEALVSGGFGSGGYGDGTYGG